MKLKQDFVTQMIDDSQIMVPVGDAAQNFKGIAKSNTTAAFIVDLLKEETDEGRIVEAMLDRYDVARSVAEADVKTILETLRSINALEE